VCCSCNSSVTTTWRGVVESTDCVGLFDSTFTVLCVDRSAAVRTNKVARAGESRVVVVLIHCSLFCSAVSNALSTVKFDP